MDVKQQAPQLEIVTSLNSTYKIMFMCGLVGVSVAAITYKLVQGVTSSTVNNVNEMLRDLYENESK